MSPPVTPEQAAAARESRLDQRCRACGAMSAASSFCYRCFGTDLEYRIHVPSARPGEPGGRVAQWCQTGEARLPDPNHPRTGVARAPRSRQPAINAPEASVVVDVSTVQLGAGL